MSGILILCALLLMLTTAPARAESLTLRECLTRALANNPLLAESEMAVQASGKAVESAEGRHFPRVGLDSSYTKREDPTTYIPAQSQKIIAHFSDEFASLGMVLTLPLYQGGQVTNGVDLAKVRRQIQEESLAQTRNDLIANTVNTYNKLLQTQKLRASSLASVAALEEQRKNAQVLYDKGRIARVDFLKVEVQLANDSQRLLALDEALDTLGATLRYLMGERTDGASEPLVLGDGLNQPVAIVDFAAGLDAAYRQRPEYRAAQKAVEEAEFSHAIAQGKLLPTINAVSGYVDQYGYDPWYHEGNWFFGFNLSLPLFDKSLYADMSREQLLKAKAEKHLRVVDHQLRLDIQNAISSLRESKNRIIAAATATEQAKEAFRIEQQKFASGAGAMVDLLLAEAADLTAEANYTQALFDYNAAMVSWRKATGTLTDYLQ